MAKGGKRPGAGRKKGTRDPGTLEKEAIIHAYKQRVMGYANDLLNTQIGLAKGSTYLYKIEKELVIGPKGGKSYKSKKPVLVTAQWEIEDYLENKLDSSDLSAPGDTYYFLTAKDPDGTVIKDMLDRTFGKASQIVVTEDEAGKQQPIGAINIVPINENI